MNAPTFPPTAGRWTGAAAWAVAAAVALAVLAGLLVPIYSDEVAIHMSRSRFLLEGGGLLSLFPQCNGTITLPVSFVSYPAAVVFSLLYSSWGELGTRVMGVVGGLAWLAIAWSWAGRHPQQWLPRRVFQAVVVALNGLGVLPFVLVLTRGEQWLVLCLAAYCLFALAWPVQAGESTGRKALKAVLFVVLTSVFLYGHPKSMFFAPLALVAAWLAFRAAPRALRYGVTALVAVFVVQVVHETRQNLACPDAPLVAKVLAGATIDFSLLRSDPPAFVRTASGNLFHALPKVLERVPVTPQFQSLWLPTLDKDANVKGLAAFGTVTTTTITVLVLGMLAVLAWQAVVQLKRRRPRPATLLALALLLGLAAHATVYNESSWHFYTPGLILPALVILFLLVVPEGAPAGPMGRRVAGGFAAYVLLLALASIVILLSSVGPGLVQVAQRDSNVIPSQYLSTAVFHGGERRQALDALAQRCGIGADSQRLVVDTSSYFTFKDHPQPMHDLYISEHAYGADIPDIRAFLKKMRSDGLVASCQFLPGKLRGQAVQSGTGMCCVAKSAWAQ